MWTHGNLSLGVFLVPWGLCCVTLPLARCEKPRAPLAVQGLFICSLKAAAVAAPQLGGHSPRGAAARPTAGLSPVLCLAVPHIVTASPELPIQRAGRQRKESSLPSFGKRQQRVPALPPKPVLEGCGSCGWWEEELL